ncbi:hypothetical protein JRO89_XS09G0196400 [Xanthoceras sorbifolium]|uniref:MATH domain-containing protein n=1 Tax=Xanthoceras sorbifolium TaxID=99658 RepID=A0ABQ8HM19_9ROSI|nr:hypothetical protein JRO89_XS09G0196400 [Xanthoceras sorbifolium]
MWYCQIHHPVNGYLIDDTCVFGAEVFVVKNSSKERCLSMIYDPTTDFYTWKVTKFSTLAESFYVSESFGHSKCIPSDTKWVVKYILRAEGQKNGEQIEFEGNELFASDNDGWGCAEFLSLAKLKDPKKGYLHRRARVDGRSRHFIGRNAPPSHYLIKIESFSILKASIKTCISDEFDAGDYKWSRNGKDHVSIYLELVQTNAFPNGWEVIGISKFFIFNQLQNKYFSSKDWCENRYHAINTRCGIAKFINVNTFSNPVNGYLIDDTCVFGAEVFVVKSTFKERCLSMINDPSTYFYTWKVTKFSTLVEEKFVSESFGHYKWNVLLCPNGNGRGKGNCISIFLEVPRSSIPANTKLFLKYILRVKDQKNGKHVYTEGNELFASNKAVLGLPEFLSLAKLRDPKMGYLVDDTLIIEAEVTLLGLVLPKS